MKRISILIAMVLFIILILSTLFGDDVYNYITPKVKVIQVNSVKINDMIYTSIPKTALIDEEYVYTVSQEQGFSMLLNTVFKKKINIVDVDFIDYGDNYIFVDENDLRRGTKIIYQLDSDTRFEDGDRVVIVN